jgi:hypothetical protein
MSSRRASAIVPFLMILAAASTAVAGDEDHGENGPSPVKVVYDEGFRLDSADGRFALRLNAGIQLRYSFVDYDPAVRFNDSDYSNFYIRRARLIFTGHAFDPKFTYFIHLQLEPSRAVNAHDLWLEYAFSDLVRLGAGRNKIAYGLEFLNSGAGLGMVERSVFSGETDIDAGPDDAPGPRYPGGGTERFALSWLADSGFATGGLVLYRSQGVQLRGHRGTASTPTFEYQAGLWQGRSTTGLSNDGTSHLYAVRVGYHPWGFVDWRLVGDGENSGRLKLGLLASAYANSGESGGGFSEHGYNFAAMLRYHGFSADAEWGGELFDFDLRSDDFERAGWRTELGWFILPAKLELKARYATIVRLEDPTFERAVASGLGVPELADGEAWVPAVEDRISEVSIGLNYFIQGWHRNKLQFDLSRLTRSFVADPDAVIEGVPSPIPASPDQVDYRVRAMVQLFF